MTHILSTEDGGATWHVQFQDEIYNLSAISFSDGQHGWAVGEYGFTYRTNDGGRSWVQTRRYFRVSDETGDIETGVTLFDVMAIDTDFGIAVGSDGVVTPNHRTGEYPGTGWERISPLFCFSVSQRMRSARLSSVVRACICILQIWEKPGRRFR